MGAQKSKLQVWIKPISLNLVMDFWKVSTSLFLDLWVVEIERTLEKTRKLIKPIVHWERVL